MKRQGLLNTILIVLVAAVVVGVAWVRHKPGEDEPAREASRPLAETPRPSVDAEAVVGPVRQIESGADPAYPPVAFDPGAVPAPQPEAVATQPEDGVPQSERVAATQPEGRLPRLVDLGSDKCVPCKKMAPILEELKAGYEGRAAVEFYDVWKDPGVGRRHGIRVIPTQIFIDAGGKEVWRHEGYLSKEEIVAQFRKMGVK